MDNGRNPTDKEVVSWAKYLEGLGAGEILLTFVDKEGAGKGFDAGLAKKVTDAVSIPVVVHGGAGQMKDILELCHQFPVSGVAIASLFHYDYIVHSRHVEGYEAEGNIDFLKSNRSLSSIESASIVELKALLISHHISCRKT